MLVAVVGPSGAGKDALIEGAKLALADNPAFVFPMREITKPAGAKGEPFIAVDEATFEARRRSGEYALSWRAHGYGYAIPAAAARAALAGDKRVVVNLSRTVVDAVRAHFPDRRIVLVSVGRDLAEQRLQARGRETSAEIAERLARFDIEVTGEDVTIVRNDGPLAKALATFISAITT